MGNGRWSANAWAQYNSRSIKGKSQAQIFTSRQMNAAYDPARITVRESRDSADNPNSTPIILASDVTGSMGMIAETLIRDGLNTLATEIYDRKPVSDPHVMIMAVGDAYTDQAPLQVTQFEADIRVAEQARELYIERGGGGNGGESYSLAHLFAATKISADAIEKHGRKGYLFTIGDEPVLDTLRREQIRRFLNIPAERDLSAAEMVEMAERNWEVFHIVLANEGYARRNLHSVLKTWQPILPERTVLLEDVNALAETVVSLIQVNEGAKAQDVANSWSGSTALVVANALRGVPAKKPPGGGLRRFF